MTSAIRGMSVASIPSPMMLDIIRSLPQPTDAFAWVQAAAGPAVVCRALEPYARHLFTSRHWSLGSAADRDSPPAWLDAARSIGVEAEHFARIHQVHGAHAVVAQPGALPDADVVVSNDATMAMAVQTADCVPLLIADSRTGAIAAAHAGWRGLASRVP